MESGEESETLETNYNSSEVIQVRSDKGLSIYGKKREALRGIEMEKSLIGYGTLEKGDH